MGEDGALEDWEIDCSDDEKYSCGTDKLDWVPDPKDIKELYEKLSRGEQLTLEWKCLYGRRSPTPERTEEEMDMASQKDEEPKEEEKPVPQEFAFEDPEPSGPVTLRTPGSTKTPKSVKRVATLDKIMDDMRRHRKLNEEGEKGAKASGSKTNVTGQGSSGPQTLKTPNSKTSSLSPASTPHLPNKGNMSPKKLS